ncbi:MAG: VOC family protein [Chloroflexota bacterium]
MILGIDHIVVGVADLEEAKREYEGRGFTVVMGGRHLTGTHNMLVSFADGSYIELIAFYEPNPDHKWWSLLQMGGGLIDVCLQTDDIATDRANFVAAGMGMTELTQSGRLRPDGFHIKWQVVSPVDELRGQVPFLIVDQTPREERVPQETVHANGATGIGLITAVLPDLTPVQTYYETALNQTATPLTLPDGTRGIGFTFGKHPVHFYQAQSGEMANRLQARGASWYAAILAGEGKGKIELTADTAPEVYL